MKSICAELRTPHAGVFSLIWALLVDCYHRIVNSLVGKVEKILSSPAHQ